MKECRTDTMDKRNRIHRKSGDGGGVEENFDLYRNRTGDVCRDAISAAAGGSFFIRVVSGICRFTGSQVAGKAFVHSTRNRRWMPDRSICSDTWMEYMEVDNSRRGTR